MFKKIFLIGIVCLITVVMVQTDAEAITRSFGGWGATSGSLTVNMWGSGMGNYTNYPGLIIVTVWPKYAAGLCWNPTKKRWPNRMGTPYFWEGEIEEVSPSEDWSIRKNGAFTESITFTNYELFPDVSGCPDWACDTNQHWTCAEDDSGQPILMLIEFNIRLELRTSSLIYPWITNETNPLYPGGFIDHEIEANCTLNEDLVTYGCTETYNYDPPWPPDYK